MVWLFKLSYYKWLMEMGVVSLHVFSDARKDVMCYSFLYGLKWTTAVGCIVYCIARNISIRTCFRWLSLTFFSAQCHSSWLWGRTMPQNCTKVSSNSLSCVTCKMTKSHWKNHWPPSSLVCWTTVFSLLLTARPAPGGWIRASHWTVQRLV